MIAPAPAPAPAPVTVNSASTLTELFLQNPSLFQHLINPSGQSNLHPPQALPAFVHSHPHAHGVGTAPAPHNPPAAPTITQILASHPPNCECRKKHHSLAEFEVNVPCPTTTQKPPKKIIVRVPCPTTSTTTTEKPCACQCCPCNPCQKPQKPHKPHKPTKPSKHSCSEESHEYKTIVKTYEVPKPHPRKWHHQKSWSEECSSEEVC